VESQTKRALELEQMNTLLCTDLRKLPSDLRCVLAYFLLMFLFRGMPFIDLAYLRKQDVKGNRIVYSRHKTGRQMTVRIPKEAMELMKEFKSKNPDSIYLFPILHRQESKKKRAGKVKKDKELYMDYLRALRGFNLKLEKIASLLLPGVKLSSYVAKHHTISI
jgi:integrase